MNRILLSPARALACLLPFLACFAPAFAQEEAASKYLVELVIFRNLDQSQTTREIRRPQNEVLSDPALAVSYVSAAADARQLNGAANSIRNLRAYDLIAQLAWVQTAEPEDSASLADLNSMGLNAAQALGTAKLYERRYLHLDVEVALPASDAVINTGRRVRLNQIYYLDHPDFGVLALVTRAN
jgi:hypothetical protein